jgi:membrane-bound lytic murein transglycosylase B
MSPPVRRFLPVVAFVLAAVAALPAAAQNGDFAAWLQGVRQEAAASGIRPATLDRALEGVTPIPRVIELDQKQPETTFTYQQYLDRVVSPQRRRDAQQHLRENRPLLEAVSRRFGVQPRFIVALWGIETNFGQNMGNFPVIGALATLAYDGRRSTFFRKELINALTIVDRHGVDPHRMVGSWAGAMGQSQFMPSSYLTYAVSWSGAAGPDIWTRREDVFASIANYLSRLGWHGDETWGRAARPPPALTPSLIGMATRKPLAEWARLGVRRGDGGALPASPIEASLVQPGGPTGPTLLVYGNYRTVLRWNNSAYFAGAVGFLADSLE